MNALSQALSQIGKFLRPENEGCNNEDDEKMQWLKESFKHSCFLLMTV